MLYFTKKKNKVTGDKVSSQRIYITVQQILVAC